MSPCYNQTAKMRILFCLLACLAATNAATYSYSFYCSQNFQVFPCTSIYSYHVYFNNAWCSCAYYSNILKVYPGEKCGKDGWSETPVDDVKQEIQNLLKESLLKITGEITARRTEWLKMIDEQHEKFAENFRSYVTKYYEYKISLTEDAAEKEDLAKERDAKIVDYVAKLGDLKVEATTKYNEAVAAKLEYVMKFHQHILENSVKCLETREKKLAEYLLNMNKKVHDYTTSFLRSHLAQVKQKADFYRQLLTKMHAGSSVTPAQIDEVVSVYTAKETLKVSALAKGYLFRLVQARNKLFNVYTCSYKCYTSNGCTRFNSNCYYKYCAKLGCWYGFQLPKTVFKFRFSPFSVCWRKAGVKNLKTCDVTKVNRPVGDIVTEMEAKVDEIIEERTKVFVDQKVKWINYFNEYVVKYTKIVQDRHAFYQKYVTAMFQIKNQSMDLTPAQLAEIDTMKAECDDLVAKIVEEYRTKLFDQIVECVTKFNADIAAYREKFAKFIGEVKAKYEDCLSKRGIAINAYKEKLFANLKVQTKNFHTAMWDAKIVHWEGYNDILEKFHGEKYEDIPQVHAVRVGYANYLVNMCNTKLQEFTECRTKMIDALITHYSCSYRCRTGCYYFPGFACSNYFRWSVRYPTECSYTTYYNIYRQYCNYNVRTCGCRYVYTN